MDTVPQEIIKVILSYLDDKNARTARVVSTEWFRMMKYAKFAIYLATSALLPQIVDRLSTYQYPIELSFYYPVRMPDIDLLDNASRLTNLKTLFLWCSESDKADQHEYLKLSTLAHLELLEFPSDRILPAELLRHLPRMRECPNVSSDETLLQVINTHCPHYESIYIPDDSLLSVVPISVTQLFMKVNDRAPEALTRLTKLKKLDISCEDEACLIDLQHITWLENLKLNNVANVKSLEYSHRLTELRISGWTNTDASILLESLTALSNLQKLRLSLSQCDVALPSLSQLTSLDFYCKSADLALLPTSLQELNLEISDEMELSDISHLVHLTLLDARQCITTAIEPLHALTKLYELDLRLYESKNVISLSTLGNLTLLHSSSVDLDPQTIKCLTNLEYYVAFTSPTQQAAMDSLHYLSHLTLLNFWSFGGSVSFDYKVIEMLPLADFFVPMSNPRDFWTVIPTITTLQMLSLDLVESEENITSLVALTKLKQLTVREAAEGVTLVHLTQLTGLQELLIYCPNNFSVAELSLKLTRLRHTYGIQQ